jgi:hypothetical protein
VELKNAKWFDRGLQNLQEAIQMAPARGDFLRETARALAANGHWKDAQMYARRAAEVEPGVESNLVVSEITANAPRESLGVKTGGLSGLSGLLSKIRRKKS